MKNYIKEAFDKKYSLQEYEESNLFHTYKDVTDAALEEAIADAEMELIEFARYSAWMEIAEDRFSWLIKTSHQRIEQFRNQNTMKNTRKPKEKKDWMELSKEQKLEITSMADRLGIPPNFVQDMYEHGEIEYEIRKAGINTPKS